MRFPSANSSMGASSSGTITRRPWGVRQGVSRSSVKMAALVTAVGPANPTIFAWDIKNELDRDYTDFGSEKVMAWARTMIG